VSNDDAPSTFDGLVEAKAGILRTTVDHRPRYEVDRPGPLRTADRANV